MSRLIAVAMGGDAASSARRSSKNGLTPSRWAGWMRFPRRRHHRSLLGIRRPILPDDSITARMELWLPETREVIRLCEPEMS